MDGLIVKKRWLNLILSGKKTIEIRGSNTKKIGQPIYLLESGTLHIQYPVLIGLRKEKNTVLTYLIQS